MSFNHVPVVDIDRYRGDPDPALYSDLRDICHRVGFFYVANHGIDEARCAEYLDAARCFFSLPETEKKRIHKALSPQFRGWEQLGSELTNNKVDHREQLDVGTERDALTDPDPYYMRLVGPNQWLPEVVLPGFRAGVLDYMQQMQGLSRRLLSLLSASLGLAPDHIGRVFGRDPMPYCKLICYPPTPAGEAGVGAHKDAGFIAILLQDETGGLQAGNGGGDWVNIPHLPGTLVVNLGEMMQIMTRNYYVATPHRVLNPDPVRTRYSLGYFYNPDLNTRLEPLTLPAEMCRSVELSDHHRSAGLMASRSQLLQGAGGMAGGVDAGIYGYKYWERWVRSYPEIARAHHPGFVRD